MTDPHSPNRDAQTTLTNPSPHPDGPNAQHANLAQEIIEAYQERTWLDTKEALGSLLTDLMHWADHNKFKFKTAHQEASKRHQFQTAPQEVQESEFFKWTLHFDREGTEDVGIICDGSGNDLVRSRHFWRPWENGQVSPTLACLWLMVAAPRLLAALTRLLDATNDLPTGVFTRHTYDAIFEATHAVAAARQGAR